MKHLLIIILLLCGACTRHKSETTPTSSIPIDIIEKCKEAANDSISSYHLIKGENNDYWVKAGNGKYSIDHTYFMDSITPFVVFFMLIIFFIGLLVGSIMAD